MPSPCSKASQKGEHPRGLVVFGEAKQGNGTPKLGNQRLDEAGGFIVRVQESRARQGLIFTTSGSERSAGLGWPFLCCCTPQMGGHTQTVSQEQLLDCAISQTMLGNGTVLVYWDSTAAVSSCLAGLEFGDAADNTANKFQIGRAHV